MMHHYPYPDSAPDWLKSNENHNPDLSSTSDMSSVWDFYARSSDAVANPDLQISEGPSLNFPSTLGVSLV